MLIDNIFVALLKSANYFRIVLPHLKPEYFTDRADRILLDTIKEYYNKYNKRGTFSAIKLMIDTDYKIAQEDTEALLERMESLRKTDYVDDEKLLIKKTEEWCKNRAFEIVVLYGADLIQNDSPNKGIMIEKAKEALSIEFEINLGHDYWDKKDFLARLESYITEEDKIPLDIDLLNEAMGGGLAKKGLFMYMANTNVGKTTWLCHSAASLVKSGQNVLYITAEMSEKEINKRIDANIMDVSIKDLSPHLDQQMFKDKFKQLWAKAHGQLIVKYAGAGSMNALHIRTLLDELRLKKNFVPDVLVLDHITLFSSSRLPASQTGSHTYIQCVVEEIRAIAGDYDCCVLSACQLNRGAKQKNEGVTSEDVALAYAIAQTADWSGALLQNEELRNANKYILKVLKTRYSNNNEKRYTIGILFDRMRLVNLSEEEQEIPLSVKDALRFQEKKRKQKEEEEDNAVLFDFSQPE